MTTIPKWTDERTASLTASLTEGETVTKATVAELATQLETSPRSVSSKLRKLGFEVETAAAAPKAFSEDEEADLREFVEANEGNLTYSEIAEQFGNGKFNARAIQGKILSMELTGSVKPTPKPETTKTYNDDEEARVVAAIQNGDFVEDIATSLGRTVASIRGKALSLLRAGTIDAMPKQREVKGQAPDSFETLGDVSKKTVAEIAEALGKTERGVKTMLTRRGVAASDYDGAARKEKASAAA
jgi:hypothetical protein